MWGLWKPQTLIPKGYRSHNPKGFGRVERTNRTKPQRVWVVCGKYQATQPFPIWAHVRTEPQEMILDTRHTHTTMVSNPLHVLSALGYLLGLKSPQQTKRYSLDYFPCLFCNISNTTDNPSRLIEGLGCRVFYVLSLWFFPHPHGHYQILGFLGGLIPHYP